MAYPTISDVKAWVGVSGSTEDDRWTTALNAAIGLIEKYTGRTFTTTTETRYILVQQPYVMDDRRRLFTFQDFSGVTAVTNGDGESVAATEYVAIGSDPYYGLELYPDSNVRWHSVDKGRVAIAADWGRSTPGDITIAVIDLTHHLYRRRQGAGYSDKRGAVPTGGMMPDGVREILEQYRK